MENIISIRKDSPGYTLVEKCLSAIAKADYSNCTRQDFDDALDSVAKSVAQEHDIPFAEAYQAVLTGLTGKVLYDSRASCPAVGTGPVVKRDDDAAIAKAAAIERDAEHFSTAYGVPLDQARRQVADFYQNQK